MEWKDVQVVATVDAATWGEEAPNSLASFSQRRAAFCILYLCVSAQYPSLRRMRKRAQASEWDGLCETAAHAVACVCAPMCVCAVCVSQQVFVAHTQIHSVVRSLTRLFSEMCENFNVFAINASVCEALERAAGCPPECVCLCACVSMCCVRLYSVCASNFDWLPKCFSSYAARSCPQRRPSWWRLCETRRERVAS